MTFIVTTIVLLILLISSILMLILSKELPTAYKIICILFILITTIELTYAFTIISYTEGTYSDLGLEKEIEDDLD